MSHSTIANIIIFDDRLSTPHTHTHTHRVLRSMKITVKESTMVKPMEETPSCSLWLSNLDLVFSATNHTRSVYFYRFDGAAANFFDAAVLKAALRRVLVEFYPFAGRLRKDDSGRIEINCNGEGVLFVEAECDGAVADLGGFSPRPDISLVPKVDYSQGLSTFPLLLVQLTRFKCGGISLGIANEHHLSDGISAQYFNKTWSDITRGKTTSAAVPPSLDRRLLSARDPPLPRFPHIEHHPPPSLKTPLHDSETAFSTFRLTRDQINALKQKCNNNNNNSSNYTTYEVVAGHVWRCVCMARGLPKEQETKLQLPVDGRRRLRPPLPQGFCGNGIFYTGAFASCGELEANPLRFAVGKVHEAIARMDDEYLRSALDYMELNLPSIVRTESNLNSPNIGITNWVRLPFYELDFGWGKPVYAGPGAAMYEGKSYLFSDPENEGSVFLAITLHKHHMKRFQKLIYDNCCLISKI